MAHRIAKKAARNHMEHQAPQSEMQNYQSTVSKKN